MWGSEYSKQDHYKAGRSATTLMRSNIEGACACGYLTLKPTSDFEQHNGGLTVKRSRVEIIDDKTGDEINILRSRKDAPINRYGNCNACVNDWR